MREGIIAVAGASSDKSKYWHKIFADLKAAGFDVCCVNPKTEADPQNHIYKDWASLPRKPQTIIIVVRPELTAEIAAYAAENGVKELWFQPGTYNEKSAEMAKEAGISVHNACFMLQKGIW